MKTGKILILHDTFLYKGGGERLILMMWKTLKADIASWFFSAGSFDLRKEWFDGEMIALSSEVFTKWFRHIKLKLSFFFKTKFLTNYDIVLFSGDSIAAVHNCSKNTKKIYYCHTPPRYIYDLHSLYLQKVPGYLRPVFRLGCKVFWYLYERDIKKMDVILTNSLNTQKRIQTYLWYDAKILYPPVDTSRFRYVADEWYFISFARLADAKRVEKIIYAFQHLPEEKLLVIYGKNDPQRQKIFDAAQGSENISFLTLEDNNLLYDYVGRARATIYIPIDEDFWMIPIESMSAGKPVLGVNDGGLKETILHEKTGYLISPEAKEEEIITAVRYLSQQRCLEMKEACIERAWEFSLEKFQQELWSIVET